MELRDITAGDWVRLVDGREVKVDGLTTEWGDRTGTYKGEWITIGHPQWIHIPIADVVEVSRKNEHLCIYCGGGVTSDKVDFCRICWATGRHDTELRSTLITMLKEIDGVKEASVWQTGGGCMCLGITLDDGRLITCTEFDAQVPEPGDPWGIVVVCTEEQWDDCTGEYLEDLSDMGDDGETPSISDAQLVDIVRKVVTA